jgi:hypothetical protein
MWRVGQTHKEIEEGVIPSVSRGHIWCGDLIVQTVETVALWFRQCESDLAEWLGSRKASQFSSSLNSIPKYLSKSGICEPAHIFKSLCFALQFMLTK